MGWDEIYIAVRGRACFCMRLLEVDGMGMLGRRAGVTLHVELSILLDQHLDQHQHHGGVSLPLLTATK